MPNVVFRPRVSERTPSRTWFAELATAPGPQVIGVTGDNSFDTLFGREWLLEWSVEDDTLRLYQESLTHPGEWERITTPLPPVFDSPLPGSARRVTFCFDQSARMVVAYEDEGVIYVTRWDPGLNQYVQNVSFAGHDPAVVMDATWAYDIPNSDVLIFYLSTDRTRVMCRVQRELYADEHEMWDYGQQVILDRAVPAFLRYQLLVADSAGAPREKVLLSDPYPYPGLDHLHAYGRGPAAGALSLVVISRSADPEALSAGGLPPTGGSYANPIIEATLDEHALAVACVSGPTGGSLTPVTWAVDLDQNALAMIGVGGPTGGSYELVVINAPETPGEITAQGHPPAGGAYAAA